MDKPIPNSVLPLLTDYEWVAEKMDGEEIVDVRHADTLFKLKPQSNEEVALVKTIGNNDEGVQDRTWAYLDEKGVLPDEFEDGTRVPKRFLNDRLKKPQRGPKTLNH